MLSDFKSQVLELMNKTDEYRIYPRLVKGREELSSLVELSENDSFWENQEAAAKILKQISKLKNFVLPWDSFFREVDDLHTLYEMAVDANAGEYEGEIAELIEKLTKKLKELEFLELLSGENDSCNAILNIHPGAGGTEACDWGMMLYRMFTRWAEKRGFSIEILDWLDGDGAGIKNVTLLIKGDFSYGFLQYESGIHRLVRISPFDSNARRHTSFASIYVTPDIEDEIEIDIKTEDLRIDTYRAGGAGGQHVNKTDSAVRMTHLPTGIVVQCQNERSQIKNRATAMKILKAKLYDHYKKEQEAEADKNNPEKKEIGWGSQIRSYVFQPYTMVKDHRTKCESGNIQAVMDGDIDEFLTEELKFFNIKH
jgi:peptide chain release factor 2